MSDAAKKKPFTPVRPRDIRPIYHRKSQSAKDEEEDKQAAPRSARHAKRKVVVDDSDDQEEAVDSGVESDSEEGVEWPVEKLIMRHMDYEQVLWFQVLWERSSKTTWEKATNLLEKLIRGYQGPDLSSRESIKRNAKLKREKAARERQKRPARRKKNWLLVDHLIRIFRTIPSRYYCKVLVQPNFNF